MLRVEVMDKGRGRLLPCQTEGGEKKKKKKKKKPFFLSLPTQIPQTI
jgi:hypothetical protein